MILTTTPSLALTCLPVGDIFERYSAQFQAHLVSTHEKVGDLKDDDRDIYYIYLYQEDLADLKRELCEHRDETLVITADASDSPPP